MYVGGFSCSVDALNQVNVVENDLKIKTTDIIFENISKASLKAAAELFIFLYPKAYKCPFEAFNTWFGVWLPFYNDLFKTQSADKIILTLNRIIKTTSHLSRNAAEDIMRRMATIFSLKYKYIQSRLPKHGLNSVPTEEVHILNSSEGKLIFFFT